MKNKENNPDYKRIFSDIIKAKYPEKEKECESILHKKSFTTIDVLKVNNIIFGLRENEIFNQKLKGYTYDDIMYILKYQAENRLNNSEISRHFKLSRNTIAQWKKIYGK